MDVLTDTSVEGFKSSSESEDDNDASPNYLVEAKVSDGSQNNVMAKKVVVATGARKAYELAGADPALLPPQRRVGCVYYGLSSLPPISDPILVLNGEKEKGTTSKPVNNLCFPSLVSETYAPPGKHLCSVTVLGPTMDLFRSEDGRVDEEKVREREPARVQCPILRCR